MTVYPTFHVAKVKPYRESPLVSAAPTPPPPCILDGKPVYMVKKCLAIRKRLGTAAVLGRLGGIRSGGTIMALSFRFDQSSMNNTLRNLGHLVQGYCYVSVVKSFVSRSCLMFCVISVSVLLFLIVLSFPLDFVSGLCTPCLSLIVPSCLFIHNVPQMQPTVFTSSCIYNINLPISSCWRLLCSAFPNFSSCSLLTCCV